MRTDPSRRAPALLGAALALGLVLAVLATSGAGAANPAGTLVEVGDFGARPPLADGQVEVEVLSTRPTLVTGGDALVGIRGVGSDDTVAVSAGGRDQTERFHRDADGRLVGLVDGLAVGDDEVAVTVRGPRRGTRRATLPVRNHPISGPIFSGPHQEPFICRTVDAGLGEPLDDDCSIRPQVEWRYRSRATNGFEPLEDPYAPYPPDTATTTTTSGATVPYVVRIESSTLNRSITRIAVLDDPAGRGPDAPYAPTGGWNRRVLYEWGQACGVGHHQGVNRIDWVLSGDHYVREQGLDADGAAPVDPPVGDGYLVVHSTLTTLGVDCNEVVSAETFTIVREHLIETYGEPVYVVGTGASGGGIQQLTTANSYPGVLDGAIPMIAFPDMVTNLMTSSDCRLLDRVFDADPVTWTEAAKRAVTGHLTSQICRDWDSEFGDLIRADTGCDPVVPANLVYDPETNPHGVRCTFQDNARNVLGFDPATGKAPLPIDNTGVEYGLEALRSGAITPQMFVDLNRDVGGYDADGVPVADRTRMPTAVAHRLYATGRVSGRGALDQVPIVDIDDWIDAMPAFGVHDQVRAFTLRERLRQHTGGAGNQLIWAGGALPQDAFPTMDTWLTALAERDPAAQPRADAVLATKPDDATDRCAVPLVGGVPSDDGCATVFRPQRSTRMAAGGPLSEDVIACQLAPLDRASHPGTFTDQQWQHLQTTFPDGVCDWSRPGRGEVARSATWLSFGADQLLASPERIPAVVARSRAPSNG